MAFISPCPLVTRAAGASRRRRLRARHARPGCVRSARMTATPPSDDGEEPEGVIDVPSEARVSDAAELKQELYTQVSALDRGFIADTPTRKKIHSTLSLLEQVTPSAEPLDDPLLEGTWELVYTNALDLLSLTLMAPVATISTIYQNVLPSYELVNVVELEPPFSAVLNLFDQTRSCTRLEVKARGSRREGDARKLDIVFERATVKQTSLSFVGALDLPGFSVPFLGGSAVGYVDTTYLDDELRIARAPPPPFVGEDGIFVLRRVAETAA